MDEDYLSLDILLEAADIQRDPEGKYIQSPRGYESSLEFVVNHRGNFHLKAFLQSDKDRRQVLLSQLEKVKLEILNGFYSSFRNHDDLLQMVMNSIQDNGRFNSLSLQNALIEGAKRNDTRITVFLLTNFKMDVNYVDSNGNTALHYAVINNDIETCKLLLEAGANKTMANAQGRTPERLAKEKRLLLFAGIFET